MAVPIREDIVSQVAMSSRLWTLMENEHVGEFREMPRSQFLPTPP